MPPSVNNLYKGMGKNRRRAPAYSAWGQEAGWRLNEARAKGLFRPLPRDRWYWTDIQLPANHNGDSDNRLKALHDLLHEMGATPDDRWLLGGTYMRNPEVLSGCVVLTATSVTACVQESIDQVKLLAARLAEGLGEVRHG